MTMTATSMEIVENIELDNMSWQEVNAFCDVLKASLVAGANWHSGDDEVNTIALLLAKAEQRNVVALREYERNKKTAND